MHSVRLTLILVLLSIVSGCPMQTSEDQSEVTPVQAAGGDRQPVLVELFTSEGCSSCPPADRELAFLEKQQPVTKADVITLAFHVDYWDRLGWKDRFSSPLFSHRQEIYAQAFHLDSNYTPQMIVDGKSQFVGSDNVQASKEIESALGSPKAAIELAVGDGRVTVRLTNAPAHKDATVFAAIAEDDISSRVEKGENSGMNLEHVSVVRELRAVGELPTDQNQLDATANVTVPTESNPDKLKVVVFLQENESRKVLGAARVSLKK